MLDWLVPDSTRRLLTPVDWLLTVLGIYFHDLGLIVPIEEFNERKSNEAFVAWVASQGTTAEGRDYLARTRRMTTEEQDRFLFQEYVRKGHASRIREWITGQHSTNWSPAVRSIASEVDELLRALPSRFRNYLGTVCESHHEDDLYNLTRYPLAVPLGSEPGEIVNVQYAAVLLRSADLLHVTKDRTPSAMFKTIRFSDPKSVGEWQRQRHTFAVRPRGRGLNESDPESAVVVVAADFTEEGPYFALQEYITYANQQLRQSYQWILDSQQQHDGRGFSFPWRRVEANVQLGGAEPVPLKFDLDRARLLDLLVGHTIYNDPTVAVRELLQNSIDAVRYQYHLDKRRSAADGSSFCPTIGKVIVTWSPNDRILTVEDNGIGMSRGVIDSHLMRVGVSFYNSTKVLIEHRDFSPISRFGIGILTCFMISDDIEIVTCRDSKGHRLRMTQVEADFALQELGPQDPKLKGLHPHGTRVTLQLRESVDVLTRSIEDIVKYWIVLPECPVEFVESGKVPVPIGFKSPEDALSSLASTLHATQSADQLTTVAKTFTEDEDFEGQSIPVRYELAFSVLRTRFPERVFVSAEDNGPLPLVCIEGIRVANSLPGFQGESFAAILSVRGSRAFRTTVSRAGLEQDEKYAHVSEIVAQLLFNHATDEIDRIVGVPGRPLSQAASAFRWLYQQLSKRADRTAQAHLSRLRSTTPSIVSENASRHLNDSDNPRELLSPETLMKFPEIWTIESRLVDSLGTISRDIGRELSLSEFVSTLAPDLEHYRYSAILPDPEAELDLLTSHTPVNGKFSHQHQYAALKWVPAPKAKRCLNLWHLAPPEFFNAAWKHLKSPIQTELSKARYFIPIFSAPIDGDSKAVQVVGARTSAVILPESYIDKFWTLLKEYLAEIVAKAESPAEFADAMLISQALFHWSTQTQGRY